MENRRVHDSAKRIYEYIRFTYELLLGENIPLAIYVRLDIAL